MVTTDAFASRMQMMRQASELYVPLLGAGCSRSSGVEDTEKMKQEIVQMVTGGNDFDLDEFDEKWRSLSSREQEAAISAYFRGKKPSVGYYALAELATAGYFDLILTTNFDDLLERVLEEKGMEFSVFAVGVDEEKHLQQFLDDKTVSIHLLKLHGCYRKSHYRYSIDQLLEFHPDVKEIFTRVSGYDMLVCGYAFDDFDILRAVNLDEGSIYFINIDPPSRRMRGILRRKNSEQNCICGTDGDFDRLFSTLSNHILR